MRVHVLRDLIIITVAGLVLRLGFISSPGHVVDLGTFAQWALAAADNPWNRAYEVTNANYPPGALLIFELIGRLYRIFIHNDPDGSQLRIALKLPSIFFDLLGGVISYLIATRFVDHRRACIAILCFDLNPAIIYDSSLWGQNDSITTVTALSATLCLFRHQRIAGWTLLAFAVLNKPPVIVLAPLFVLEAFAGADISERRRRLVATGLGFTCAIACGYLTALPFYNDTSLIAVYSRMIKWYQVGSSLYPYTSANGFNLYALGGDFFASDDVRILFLPLKVWADWVFVAIAAMIYWRYARRGDDRAFLEAAFLIMLAFFLVLTEMHERYLMYALTFVVPLAALDRRYVWSTLALTVTQWLNLEYSLSYMWIESDKPAGINPKEFAPVLVHLCALTNLGVGVLGLRAYFANAAEPGAARGRFAQPP